MSTPAGQGGGAAQIPVCPRHPGRESYVRCQRCERPVCPECQRPAAVGIQCVDCVRAAGKTTRTARTVFGGQVGSRDAWVTKSIIGLCVLAYLMEWLFGETFTDALWYSPIRTLAEPWRMISAAFLHAPPYDGAGAPLHILLNMYALWMIGPYLETLLGPLRFAALYLLSAFGGSVGYLLLANPSSGYSWVKPTVGASGAIFGLFAALLLVNRRLGRESAGIVGLIAMNFAFGFMPGLNIAWQAHLGGLITGAVATGVLAYTPQQRRAVLHPAGLILVGILLLALTAVKIATVPAELFS